MKKVIIKTEYIKLNAFLKYADIISTGSDAKIIIEQNKIKVNGEIALQRGKKLREGDIVEIEDLDQYKIEVLK